MDLLLTMRLRDILHRRSECLSCGGKGNYTPPVEGAKSHPCDSCGGTGNVLLGLNPLEARAVLARLLDRLEAVEINLGLRPLVDDINGVA